MHRIASHLRGGEQAALVAQRRLRLVAVRGRGVERLARGGAALQRVRQLLLFVYWGWGAVCGACACLRGVVSKCATMQQQAKAPRRRQQAAGTAHMYGPPTRPYLLDLGALAVLQVGDRRLCCCRRWWRCGWRARAAGAVMKRRCCCVQRAQHAPPLLSRSRSACLFWPQRPRSPVSLSCFSYIRIEASMPCILNDLRRVLDAGTGERAALASWHWI